jgi:nucleotide-binding universal stress UspA family protein
VKGRLEGGATPSGWNARVDGDGERRDATILWRGRGPEARTHITTILVAVSAETPSNGVLDLVCELGRGLGATVVAFHVREWLFRGSEWVLGEGAFVEGRAEAARLLDQVIGRIRSAGIPARGIAGGGRPGQVGRRIIEVARAERADLIVLGFHRHSFVDELLGGSVARKVRRGSSLPVVTVPRGRRP